MTPSQSPTDDAPPPSYWLVRVAAPHFVAGLVMRDGLLCVETAPILSWAIGWHAHELRAFFRHKKWSAAVVKRGEDRAALLAQATSLQKADGKP